MIRRTYLRWVVNVQIFQSTHRVSDATGLLATLSANDPLFQSTHRVSNATDIMRRLQSKDAFQSTHRVSNATCFVDDYQFERL